MRREAAVLLALVAASALRGGEEAKAEQKKGEIPKDTIVSAYLNVPHEAGKNIVWCSTFQIAWDALGKDLCGEPLKLEGTPQMETELNKGEASKDDLDAESYLIRTGAMTKETLDEVRSELEKRFGEKTPRLLDQPDFVPTDGPMLLAYAYLLKKLAFATPFEKLENEISWKGRSGQNTRLKGFGVSKLNPGSREAAFQVVVVDFQSSADFIVELVTKGKQDHVYVAVVKPKSTLKETANAVRARVAAGRRGVLEPNDVFEMPNMATDLDRRYGEIIGRKVLGGKLKGDSIFEARQTIEFRLNEAGVVLKSEAVMGWTPAEGEEPKWRWLVVDKPFLVCLERDKAKAPYFAMWVENPALLEKSDAAPFPEHHGGDEVKK